MTTPNETTPEPWATLRGLGVDTLARDLWTATQRAERAEKRAHEAERRERIATAALGSTLIGCMTGAAFNGLVQDGVAYRRRIDEMTAEIAALTRDLAAERLRLTVERQERAEERAQAMAHPGRYHDLARLAEREAAPEDPAWAAYRRGEVTAAPLTPEAVVR